MAQIKIEITYDPSTETLEQAVSSLVPKTAIDPNALGEAVTQEALARLRKTSGKAETPNKTESANSTPAAADEIAAPAETEGAAAKETASGKPGASPSDAKPEKKVSKTDVRAIATVLSKAGKRDQLSAIFAEFGGKKLSDIKEEDYPALMEKLEAANG